MSALAPAAGISVGQIYRLFANKGDIIRALVREDADERLGVAAEVIERVRRGESSVLDALTCLAHRALSESDEALSFEILAEAHRNAEVADLIATLCVRFRATFRDLACIANPRLTASDLDGFEELVLAIMFGLGHRQLSRSCLSIDETAARTGRILLMALQAEA